MTVVTFTNPAETFNRALSEILRKYFDGSVHTISDIDFEFPEAEIRIDVRPITTDLTLPVIAITGSGAIDFQKYKCRNPNDASLHGYQLWATAIRNVTVAVSRHGGVEDHGKPHADLIWSLLHALFASKVGEFATRKIFKCQFPPVPEDTPENSDIIQSSGVLTCEIRLDFACYNLSEV